MLESPSTFKEKIEKKFGITYVEHITYADWKVEGDIKKLCKEADKKGMISPLARWLGKLHAHEMAEKAIPDIGIKFVSKEKGYGLFTNTFIKKWSYVGQYAGLVRRRALFFPKLNDYCFMYPREWFSFKLFTIDSLKHGNYTRFINHSDYPNLESVGVYKDGAMHIIFRAVEDILPDTELTYDYGDVYWKKREKIKEEKKN